MLRWTVCSWNTLLLRSWLAYPQGEHMQALENLEMKPKQQKINGFLKIYVKLVRSHIDYNYYLLLLNHQTLVGQNRSIICPTKISSNRYFYCFQLVKLKRYCKCYQNRNLLLYIGKVVLERSLLKDLCATTPSLIPIKTYCPISRIVLKLKGKTQVTSQRKHKAFFSCFMFIWPGILQHHHDMSDHHIVCPHNQSISFPPSIWTNLLESPFQVLFWMSIC